MKIETINELKEVFKNAVREAVAKGGHARWGEAESVAVIEALVENYVSNADAQTEGFDAIRANVSRVVNPSAFAQFLEKLPEDHASKITRPKRGSGGARGTADV